MTHRIKITAFLDIEDDEFDPGPNGPLTNEAWESVMDMLTGLDDINFEEES